MFILLLSAFSGTAQEVVSSQGETCSNANGSMDFTVGEVISIESSTWTSSNSNSAFSTVLKLTTGGMRCYTDGSGNPLLQVGVQGLYWTSSTFLDNLNNYNKSDFYLIKSSQAILRSGSMGAESTRNVG